MSYGWLTESAFLPSQKKKIEIESSSFVDVKINLLKEKEKLKLKKESSGNSKEQIVNSQIKFKDKGGDINEDERDLKDISTKVKEPELDYSKVQENLIRKQRIYEKFKNSKFLTKEEENFKEDCLVDFEYKKLFDKNKSNHKEHPQYETVELKCEERNQIKQSFDLKLSNEGKEALRDVLKEEGDYKNKLLMLKKKKEREREERLERVKNLKRD